MDVLIAIDAIMIMKIGNAQIIAIFEIMFIGFGFSVLT
jgi:hypothetical protein